MTITNSTDASIFDFQELNNIKRTIIQIRSKSLFHLRLITYFLPLLQEAENNSYSLWLNPERCCFHSHFDGIIDCSVFLLHNHLFTHRPLGNYRTYTARSYPIYARHFK